MKVEGKVAIITGGGTGVGRATALRLAQLGCSVAINYKKSREEAEETAQQIRSLGALAITVQGDVAVDIDCQRIIASTVKNFSRIDILVNNAGTTQPVPYDNMNDITEDMWQQIMDVNVRGAFQCARAARSLLQKEGGGEIVNVSSIAGISGAGSSIPYSASKAALINLTMTLARTMAPNVRVNAVAPGFITGRWCEKLLGDQYEETKQYFADSALLKKVCEPEDIADTIVSLVTGSDVVTGQWLTCDAGLLLGGH
jgi:3-oxoacyl-[acyl-carrier protein] reductase